MAEAPVFIIEEVTGSRRKVELKGRSLPYRGVPFGVTMRTKTTWYPGNPQATQQVLGPEVSNTTINGVWKDRFLTGNIGLEGFDNAFVFALGGESVVLARDLVRAFQQLVQAGNTLRVEWGPEVREGIMVSFEPIYDRIEDVAWTCEFEWSARNDQFAPRAAFDLESLGDIGGAMNNLDDLGAFSPLDVITSFQAQVFDKLDRFRELTSDVFDSVRTVQQGQNTTAAILGKLSTTVESIRAEAQEAVAGFTEPSIPEYTVVTFLVDVLSIEGWRRENGEATGDYRFSAQQIEANAVSRGDPPPLQTVIAPQDTTLYTISTRFYGTPDFAEFLRQNNRLPNLRVSAGTRINIPPRPAIEEVC